MHKILVVVYEWLMRLVFGFPRFILFNLFKKAFLEMRGADIGSGVIFYPGLWITPGNKLKIGDNVNLSKDVIITTQGGVEIGDRTYIGYSSKILSSNHKILESKRGVHLTGKEKKMIKIGSDVWIGANVVITAGVEIGDGSVIAANAVVVKNVDDDSLYGGVPAKKIRSLR